MAKKDTPNRLLEVSKNNTIPKPLCLSRYAHQLQHSFHHPQTLAILLFFYTVSDFLQCSTALKLDCIGRIFTVLSGQ